MLAPQSRPNPHSALENLKDFQRDTVDYVFQRMYLDAKPTRRFLVADEVGLGKTLVARGVIAKTIDHLWDRTDRIDVIYVCSNADIARQNINRLRVGGCQEFSLSSRITLLPISLGAMQSHRINFISFTPGTSLDLKDSAGVALERALLYWLLHDSWSLSFKRATCGLQGYMGIDSFRLLVERFPAANKIHPEIQSDFLAAVALRPELRRRFDESLEALPRAGFKVSKQLRSQANRVVGDLRRVLAESCLRWLQPDLIILDEFQRFKHLLQGESDDASDAAQLATQLFNYEVPDGDPANAARVLLLSATPYKMYTLSQEAEQDDHYEDFRATLNFLVPDSQERQELSNLLAIFRQELYRLADHGVGPLAAIKQQLEAHLRRVMVRTERLAISADRNGMLTEIAPVGVKVTVEDLQQYVGLQRVATRLGHDNVMEYWKSSPYLLNFMEEYDLKRQVKRAIESGPHEGLARDIRSLDDGMLNREDIEAYRRLDPANARLRGLHQDTIERGAWRLLWIAPSLPYYQGSGPFADPLLANFTKRLVFSSWRVVPKAIASVLSYEAERSMMLSFRRKAKNTPEARQRKKALLRFAISKGRATGMPVVGLVYPCRTLAEQFDPLTLGRGRAAPDVLAELESGISALLPGIGAAAVDSDRASDDRWYWAAPLLLDLHFDRERTQTWFAQTKLAKLWSGGGPAASDDGVAQGWADHLKLAADVINQSMDLGPPPADLARVLAEMALAGLGVTALRTVNRILGADAPDCDGRTYAAPLAYSFLHLFNLPEAMYLVRDRKRETPYWRSVLEYCVAGNLQAVLDEYAHLLIESLGVMGQPKSTIAADVTSAMASAVTLRTATAKADLIDANRRPIRLDDQFRFRTRFAMRFGDQDSEDGGEATRADQVRAAFNSPYWPFVLASTSVGQEGLDFHPYCHAVVHWNLPSNPVDLEQREGRVHRYKGHAIRKNIAYGYGQESRNGDADPWEAMFTAARQDRETDANDLFPFWISPDGPARIERHVPAVPHSREILQQAQLRRSLVLYRMVFGQNRQQDLVEYLMASFSAAEIEAALGQCRVNLAPPKNGNS